MIVTADHTCVWVKPGWTLEKLTTGHLQLSRAEGFLRAKGFLNGG